MVIDLADAAQRVFHPAEDGTACQGNAGKAHRLFCASADPLPAPPGSSVRSTTLRASANARVPQSLT